jgi:hypothetical protein
MQVFVSWSGSKSQKVAVALRDWLPCVLQGVKPFVSSQDINAGGRWQHEIATHLQASNFGIVCVTRENQDSRWLNFEAGALAKSVQIGRVVPLAIDLSPADVRPPMGQFQAKPADQSGMGEVVASVNEACEPPLTDAIIEKSFQKWWPELSERLAAIEDTQADAAPPPAPARSDRELLEEVLNAVRTPAPRDPGDLDDFIAAVMLEYVGGFGTTRSSDLVTISAPNEVPRRARRLIASRANAEGLKVRFEFDSGAQRISETEKAQLDDSESAERS